MVVKAISLVTLFCSVVLYILSANNPADPLFFIVSSNEGVQVMRIIISTVLVVAVFIPFIQSFRARFSVGVAGTLMFLFGLLGFFTNSFGYGLSDYFKALDLMILGQVGIAFALLALEPQKHDAKKPAFTLPALPAIFKKLKPSAS